MKNSLLRRISCLLLSCLLVLSFAGCSSDKKNDIVVLFTNDVNCAIDDNIGYAGLLSYKKTMQSQTPYVTLVDLGNAIQGDYIGTVSKGTYIVDIMNKVKYDFAVLGNHEFDYGMEQLSDLIERSEAQYLAANISYKGENEEGNALAGTKPYEIVKYGGTKVAFIGVTTPKSLTKATPSNFKEEDVYVYDFKSGSSGSKLYTNIQGYVNECRNKGADYVIILSHLGDTEECEPYTSTGLIKATFDVDAVLDAHAGSEISNMVVKNKNGEDVLLSSAGTELSNIGKLVISQNGHITTSLVSGYSSKDSGFNTYYEEVKATYETEMNQVVAICDTALKLTDDEGVSLVKNRETTIGNFCADAYRTVAEADVAFVNGDAIQSPLPVGDVLYADILNLHPYGNTLCKVKASGQEIIDALEIASMNTATEYAVDGRAVGENDCFMQVSGLKYTIDTSVKSTVVFDDLGMFKEITGDRRVKNVQILNDRGGYTPINPEAEYTVASNNYLIKESGGGINIFADNSLLIDGGMPDYQVLLNYLTEYLGGQLGSRYSVTEGRIVIK